MDTVLFILSRVLLALFVIGVVGCFIVIPATALQLFKAMVEPDTDEDLPAHTQKMRTIS